jgi:hypothetical protein
MKYLRMSYLLEEFKVTDQWLLKKVANHEIKFAFKLWLYAFWLFVHRIVINSFI